MCGIAGKYNFEGKPVDPSLLVRMAKTMIHRGPDDEGFYVRGPFGMVMRRLSIIDLGSGRQPISNEDESVWVTFNGEIYNYLELRDELLARGHQFKTATDTEIIVHLYEEEGEACVERLRGMFAFAVWDEKARTLLLARDRLGKKPLYYALLPDRSLVFASELKAILEDETVDRGIDLEAVNQYVSLLYVPAPASIFAAVKKLPAGHILLCTRRGMTVREYWDIPLHREGFECRDVPQTFAEHLEEAVRIRLRSDVPLGAFLSGGVDSSAVVATMAGLMSRPVVTASMGFEEVGYNELPYARIVASHIASQHHERMVKAPSPELIRSLVWHLDEPFADSSAIPTYFVSLTARERVKVALSGDGGDELFAGYSRHRIERIEHSIRGVAGEAGARRLARAASWLPDGTKGRNSLLRLALPAEAACVEKFCCTPQGGRLKRDLYTPWFCAEAEGFDPVASYRQAYRRAESLDPLSRMLYVDLKTYLADDILVKVDRMSMACSLEVRAPLLDHKLVEFVASLPPRWKLNGSTSKALLRQHLAKRVPREAYDRGKHGFVSPIRHWLRNELAEFVEGTICSSRALQRGYFDPSAVRKLWATHREGRGNLEHEVWMLLVLEIWHQTFADEPCGSGARAVREAADPWARCLTKS
jgi:asparagine synthase (glutamine-hydrolysing)